jgi:hypothetical protein
MNDGFQNLFETDEGRIIEKEPVVGVAVVDARHNERWEGSGYVGARPITLHTVVDNREFPFDGPVASLGENEHLVGCFPVSGMWKVSWVPERDSEYDIAELGYEYDGATCHNWDSVIDRVKEEVGRRE